MAVIGCEVNMSIRIRGTRAMLASVGSLEIDFLACLMIQALEFAILVQYIHKSIDNQGDRDIGSAW
jgi:hypothetical protein